MSDIMTRISD